MTANDLKKIDNIKNISVQIYNGLHIRSDIENFRDVDLWLRKKLNESEIEKAVNHLHIYDIIDEEMSENEYMRICEQIAKRWRENLGKISDRYKVETYEGYGPEITFYYKR